MEAQVAELESMDPEVADADHCLRAASRRFPDALLPYVVNPEETVAELEWTETQVATQQLRLDRTLLVRLNDGEPRSVHIEWTNRLNRRVRERTAEYHWNLASQALHDARNCRKSGDRRRRAFGIESVIVVLSGRKKPWGAFGVYRSSPKRSKFSGVRFRIEAVYQKSVEQLESMGSVFWLGFVPLANDVDEDKLRRVIHEVRRRVDADDFAELSRMMLSMAKLKKGVPNFVDVVKRLLKQEDPVLSFVFEPAAKIEAAKQKACEEAHERGLQEGRQEGRQEGYAQGLAPLVRLLERRLRRPLSAREQRRLVKRLQKDGPEKLSKVVDFARLQLENWLAPRISASKKRGQTKVSRASQ